MKQVAHAEPRRTFTVGYFEEDEGGLRTVPTQNGKL
jgi:hypothetical protein